MKYIDKTLRRQAGEQIVTEFLDCFHKRKNAYPDDMYNAFTSEIDDAHGSVKFRQRLMDEVLNPEQDGRCCYCMRKLSMCKKVTVEHIMPNHAVDKAELDTYRTRATELDGLPHPDDFKANTPIVYPPHPHSIAYQNLALSCDGDFFKENAKPVCCNLKREHRFLPPLILYPDITQTFVYMVDGTAEWTENPEPPESRQNAIRVLNLNNSLLKMVRRIWFFCNDNGLDPRKDEKSTVINTMTGYLASDDDAVRVTNMLMNFKNNKYWKLLLEYDAFARIEHS